VWRRSEYNVKVVVWGRMIFCSNDIYDSHMFTRLRWLLLLNIIICTYLGFLQKMCFSLWMTSNYICYCSTPHECVATVEQFGRITNDIHYEYVKGGSSNQYSHKVWCNIGHFFLRDTFLLQVPPCGICGGQSDTRTHFLPNTSGLPCHFHSYTYSHSIPIHALFLQSQ
jgi:hypothetical protein